LIGAGSDFDFKGGRIANATRVWQVGQDVDVHVFKDAEFIVAAMCESGEHKDASSTLRLEWRNVSTGGSFAALSSSGELKYGSNTDLVDGNAVTHGEEGVTATNPANHEDGQEHEGSNAVLWGVVQGVYHEEHQYAISCSDAIEGNWYEFRVWDETEGAAVGTLLCQVKISATPVVTDVSLNYGPGC